MSIATAEFYGALKSKWNGSPFFGSARQGISQSDTPYTVLWDASSGYYWWREIIVSPGGISLGTRYLHHADVPDEIPVGSGWIIQMGGASFNYLFITGVPSSATQRDIWLNAYRFLYLVGYIPRTDESLRWNFCGITGELKNESVRWQTASSAGTSPADIHAIWFRKPGSRLTAEICERAASWPAMNPSASFHIWTDIEPVDLADWLVDVSGGGGAWELLRTRCQIHFASETAEAAQKGLDMFAAGDGLRRAFSEKTSSQHLVFKTDFLRVFILAVYGGVYVDFNDCICLEPLADLFNVYSPESPLAVTDGCDLEHANNFFLYCPQGGHPTWSSAVKSMVVAVEEIIRIVEDSEMRGLISAALTGKISADVVGASYLAKYPAGETIPWKMVLRKMKERLIGRRLDRKEDPPISESLVAGEAFSEIYADEWMDANFRILMHATNIAIHCRQIKIPLELVAWGYYRPYNCVMSWMAHIGDGSSYGRPDRGIYSIRNM
jgi:hypothetical protein